MSQRIDARILDASLFVENVLANPDLLAVFETAGHDAAYFEDARAVIETAHRRALQQRREYARSHGTTEALKGLRAAADARYKKHLRWARHLFDSDPLLRRRLELKGKRETRFGGWLRQVTAFYDEVLGDAGLSARMVIGPVTLADLEAARDAVRAVGAAHQQRQNEAGQAERATTVRDAAVARLDAFWREETELARLLFADDPQQLERLGLFARS